ncbi:hypothetical protein rosag_25110 [Roseisolibacter agri]|uniref:Uncharacterized protein n=1 Tax=Roseisolibacter agri TaxID=2014610 RepID=A0AA37QFS2_9BACT|nr:hypothetical protein rosag_25110 [Roseisolibacter agri]
MGALPGASVKLERRGNRRRETGVEPCVEPVVRGALGSPGGVLAGRDVSSTHRPGEPAPVARDAQRTERAFTTAARGADPAARRATMDQTTAGPHCGTSVFRVCACASTRPA